MTTTTQTTVPFVYAIGDSALFKSGDQQIFVTVLARTHINSQPAYKISGRASTWVPECLLKPTV